MWKHILLYIAIIAGTAGTGFAQDQGGVNVEFEYQYWFSELRANAQISGATERGTEFNLERDLGLGDKNIGSGRFTWFTGPKSRLLLEWSRADYSADRVLDKTLTVRDKTYDIGASVSTDLKLTLAKFGWIWEFINHKDGTFRLGTLLEGRAVFSDISISGEARGVGQSKSEKSIDFGLPTLGIAMDYNPAQWANIYLMTSGMYFGRYGYFAWAETGVKLFPVKFLSISGGYRWESVEARNEGRTNQITFVFTGPFASASLRF